MTGLVAAITMPKWGLTMTEGKVVGWSRAQGATFAAGDELLEIETSKITNVVEAEEDGTLLRIVAPEGATLPIGALLAVTGPADTPTAEIDAFVAGFEVVDIPDDQDACEAPAAPAEVAVAGHRLRYLDIGGGTRPAMLLLHGFGADLNSWMFTQPALAEDRRVIAVDLPGHGGSSRDVGAGDVNALTSVIEAFLTAIEVGPVHLVGHSMGGAIAMALAERRPDLVWSLTLIAPAGLGPEINADFIDGFIRASRRKEATDVLRLLVNDPALISRTMVEDVLRFKRLDGVPAALETIAQAWFPAGQQRWVAARETKVPTQIIWGAQDRIVPAAHAGAMRSAATVHVVDLVGHLPHMEKAAEVNRLIRRFVDG